MIDKIAKEKFDEAKSIVQDSNCTVTDFDESRTGVFRINAESQDGITVILNCTIVKSVIMEEIKISYEIRRESEIVYDKIVGLERQDYGIVEFHKKVDELDEEAKEFTADNGF